MKTTVFSKIARAVRRFFSGGRKRSESRFKYIIHEGWVWDADKLSLLEKAKEAVSQLWINKANAYLGELCLKFKCSPEILSKKLQGFMPQMGYTEKECTSLVNWIRGYRTGINWHVKVNRV